MPSQQGINIRWLIKCSTFFLWVLPKSLKLCVLHSQHISVWTGHVSSAQWQLLYLECLFFPLDWCPRVPHFWRSNHSVGYSCPPNSPSQRQDQLRWGGKCLLTAASYHLCPERGLWKGLLQDQIQTRGTAWDFKRVERKANLTLAHKDWKVYLFELLYYKSHQEPLKLGFLRIMCDLVVIFGTILQVELTLIRGISLMLYIHHDLCLKRKMFF